MLPPKAPAFLARHAKGFQGYVSSASTTLRTSTTLQGSGLSKDLIEPTTIIDAAAMDNSQDRTRMIANLCRLMAYENEISCTLLDLILMTRPAEAQTELNKATLKLFNAQAERINNLNALAAQLQPRGQDIKTDARQTRCRIEDQQQILKAQSEQIRELKNRRAQLERRRQEIETEPREKDPITEVVDLVSDEEDSAVTPNSMIKPIATSVSQRQQDTVHLRSSPDNASNQLPDTPATAPLQRSSNANVSGLVPSDSAGRHIAPGSTLQGSTPGRSPNSSVNLQPQAQPSAAHSHRRRMTGAESFEIAHERTTKRRRLDPDAE